MHIGVVLIYCHDDFDDGEGNDNDNIEDDDCDGCDVYVDDDCVS